MIHVFELVNNSLLCSTVADYDPDSASVTFTAGQGPGAIQSFTFDIIDDNMVESLESFSVEGDVSAATIVARFSNGQSSAVVDVNIQDNDGTISLCHSSSKCSANTSSICS